MTCVSLVKEGAGTEARRVDRIRIRLQAIKHHFQTLYSGRLLRTRENTCLVKKCPPSLLRSWTEYELHNSFGACFQYFLSLFNGCDGLPSEDEFEMLQVVAQKAVELPVRELM